MLSLCYRIVLKAPILATFFNSHPLPWTEESEMMQSILGSIMSLMRKEQILCTPSLPYILLHYCTHGTLHGGRAVKSGTIFHVLPSFNETSLTSENSEDSCTTARITVLKLFLPIHAIVTSTRKLHLYLYWLCACNSTKHSSVCKGKTKDQGSFHDPTHCNFMGQMKGGSSEASRCHSNNRMFCIHRYLFTSH
jgi:hypothetical protein